MVNRYDIEVDWDSGCLDKDIYEDGEWVRYEDHKNELEKSNKKIADLKNGLKDLFNYNELMDDPNWNKNDSIRWEIKKLIKEQK
jgi:hypothetical protein